MIRERRKRVDKICFTIALDCNNSDERRCAENRAVVTTDIHSILLSECREFPPKTRAQSEVGGLVDQKIL